MTHIKLSTKTLATALLLFSMQRAQAQYTGTLAFNNVESGAAYAYGTNSTAIGSNAYAYGTNSIVLGFDASANVANSVAIGYGAVANRGAQTYTDPFSGQTVSSVGEVSFGSSAGGAQLTNLAPGSASTDAATVGQVESATSGILSQANSYTNSQTSGILGSAESYAAGQASSALSSANSYTNASSASTLGAAQTYTNNSSAATLTSAKMMFRKSKSKQFDSPKLCFPPSYKVFSYAVSLFGFLLIKSRIRKFT